MLQIDASFPEKLQVLFQGYAQSGLHARYKVLYGGRSAGRSWGVSRAALLIGMGGGPAGSLQNIEGKGHNGLRVLCVREIQKSINESIKRTLSDQMVRLQLTEFYEVLDTVIRGRKGTTAEGTEFFFEGLKQNTNKIKSYEGIDLVIAEEAEPISERSWTDLLPTIRLDPPGGPLKLGSEFWINFNPVLATGYTYRFFVLDPPPDAVVVKMTYLDNKWSPDALLPSIEHMKKSNYDLYLHTYMGECLTNLEGAVYKDELREATEQGRFGDFPVSRMAPVSVYFDIGHSDYTVMWFVQRNGWDFRVVDFYMNNRKHIDYYLEILQSRGYIYDCLWLPHDAKSKTIGTKMSIEEQVRAKGYKDRCRIVPKLSLQDGIQAVRTVFPNCYFDQARCTEGIYGLQTYVYDIDSVTQQLGKTPIHSDIADAFRYFAVASRMGHNEFHINLPPVDGRPRDSDSGSFGRFGDMMGGLLGGSSGWLRG